MKEEKSEEESSVWARVKPKKINLRHMFGGLALILIIAQFLTGLYMIFYYEPSLKDTYKTVQYFNNETYLGAITRNIHRYGAFFLGVAVFIHFWRSYFRRDYQGGRVWNWETGIFLSLLVWAFLITGTILPWEWKGYWMMEMFNNWLKNIPLVGDGLYNFFMTAYTPTRNFIIHDIILPILTFIALEIHLFSRLRKRGVSDYMTRTVVLAIPLLIAILIMSLVYPVPTEDPEIIPLPMEGVNIPAPEWFFISLLMPIWYYPPRNWPMFLFWIPFIFLLIAIALPFINKRKKKEDLEKTSRWRRVSMGVAYVGAGVLLSAFISFGVIWSSVDSPWMGCNSCHNVAMGDRMGIPPVTYKDTERNPLLLDNRWMIRHWYQPQVVW